MFNSQRTKYIMYKDQD